MTLLVSTQSVRDYLLLETPSSSSQYSDGTIASNIQSAQSELEQICHRYFVPRTFDASYPWRLTTMLRAQVPLPGFRTFTSVMWGGSLMEVDVNNPGSPSVWAIPDSQQTGIFTGLQFRAFRADASGRPWWVADPQWFDKALDSPFFPGNYGGGYFYSSMPNDLLIQGAAGYDPTLDVDSLGGPPSAVLNAIKILAAWHTVRPPTIMANQMLTPQGGVLNFSGLPHEVQDFIASWTIGQQVVSVGG